MEATASSGKIVPLQQIRSYTKSWHLVLGCLLSGPDHAV